MLYYINYDSLDMSYVKIRLSALFIRVCSENKEKESVFEFRIFFCYLIIKIDACTKIVAKIYKYIPVEMMTSDLDDGKLILIE